MVGRCHLTPNIKISYGTNIFGTKLCTKILVGISVVGLITQNRIRSFWGKGETVTPPLDKVFERLGLHKVESFRAGLKTGSFILTVCDLPSHIAARALATYLIPGCVGRGVRLGSEGSSVGGGGGGGGGVGVWKSGNLS